MQNFFSGCTFDDFILPPRFGVRRRRKDADISMQLTRRIRLHTPIISSNMDTVTGKEMAKAMALEGGIGILHRNCTIEDQVSWVRYVKTRHAYVIENPVVLPLEATLGQAIKIIEQHKASGILIEDSPGSRRLVGILSHRDIPSENHRNLDVKVSALMTPREDLIVASEGIPLEEAEHKLFEIKKEKLPLVDNNGRIKGLITMRDIKLYQQKPLASKDEKGRLRVGAAVGATGDFIERAGALLSAGADCIVMDIAHGHSIVMQEAFTRLREAFPKDDLIAGNVGTMEGSEFLSKLGADAIKVGIGPGRGCRTRLEVGAGVPQLDAIHRAYLATYGEVPIIADGGVKYHKDIFLAVAAGATTVMLGSQLAGTDESPGESIRDPRTGDSKKLYRGMTSPQAVLNNPNERDATDALETPAEGQSIEIKNRGSVVATIADIRGHMQSWVSYAGEKTAQDAHNLFASDPQKYLLKQSEAARTESYDRD